jgi:hypothetical protein
VVLCNNQGHEKLFKWIGFTTFKKMAWADLKIKIINIQLSKNEK